MVVEVEVVVAVVAVVGGDGDCGSTYFQVVSQSTMKTLQLYFKVSLIRKP